MDDRLDDTMIERILGVTEPRVEVPGTRVSERKGDADGILFLYSHDG